LDIRSSPQIFILGKFFLTNFSLGKVLYLHIHPFGIIFPLDFFSLK
jgi:hypothetical protein